MALTSVEQRPAPVEVRRALHTELLVERFGELRTLVRERFWGRR